MDVPPVTFKMPLRISTACGPVIVPPVLMVQLEDGKYQTITGDGTTFNVMIVPPYPQNHPQ
jgi:hypothetical protein